MHKNWVVLFSQTGGEIADIIDATGRTPDLILTNTSSSIDERIRDKAIYMKHEHIEEFLIKHHEYIGIVTLHGYMKVLSSEVCELPFDIYNGHPAPIHLYPELKGKDKQEDQYTKSYEYIGTVIHKVTEDLDSGSIVLHNSKPNELTSVEDAYKTLKQMSLELWIEFFK